MDGESAAINVGRHLTVGNAGPDCYRFRLGIEFDLVEMFERDLFNGTVGDAIEGVTRPERPEMRALANTVPHVFNSICEVEVLGTVRVIPGPVRAVVSCCLRGA